MKTDTTFIIIDDNVIDILIYKRILKAKFNDLTIIDFIRAQRGLEYIQRNYSKKTHQTQTILLLDLIMPEMSGWEFLEQFDKMNKKIKSQIKIFVVSFCTNPKSKELAALNSNVEMFISKPLNNEKIFKILELFPIT